MAKTELATASVLAFERKLDPSDGLFSAGRWEDISKLDRETAKGEVNQILKEHPPKTPLTAEEYEARIDAKAKALEEVYWPTLGIRLKAVRGTASHRRKTKGRDPAKLDMEFESPNPQTVDVATLPNNADTLRVRFTLRVLGGAGAPSACNNAPYLAKLQDMVQSYVSAVGFGELAQRYAVNLANGRFLWRNRIGAEEVIVKVRHLIGGKPEHIWQFNALDFSLRDFKTPDKDEVKAHLDQLTAVIQAGLAGENYTLLEVVAFARVGDGQEVYPSQELILDKGDKKGQKSKTLYHVNEVAALHSQKIGNALRTIDTWYPNEAGDALGPIAVEPYGSVTNQGRAYRQPKDKADFYSLLDSWVLKDKAPDKDNQHFVMATLIRGGVFGESDKE